MLYLRKNASIHDTFDSFGFQLILFSFNQDFFISLFMCLCGPKLKYNNKSYSTQSLNTLFLCLKFIDQFISRLILKRK